MSNPAETYESYMVPTLFRPWASRLIEMAKIQPGERVLDLACGTGIVARRIAQRNGSTGAISGLDISPHMLNVARIAAEREGFAIEWCEGQAEKMPFPDGSFDLVMCQFALMFFADRQAALAETYRVLTNGGRCFFSVWQSLDRHPFYETLHHNIERRLGMSGVKDIFSLGNADLLGRLLKGAGFQQVHIESASMTARFPNPEGFLAGEIDVDTASIPSMQNLDAQKRQEIIASISGDMQPALQVVTDGDHVVIPFYALIAGAER